MKNLKQTKGITLIALIITIIVLLILAGVTIGMLIGDNGILKNVKISKEKQSIERGLEQIELVLGEDTIKRVLEKRGLKISKLGELFLEQEWQRGVEIFEDESKIVVINDEGYVYEIIIDEKGELKIVYIGIDTAARITRIIVTDKNTNSISIEVEVVNAENAKYTYWYRKQGTEEYVKANEKSEQNTYTYKNLEADIIYEIKVEIESDKGKAEKQREILTGNMPEGTITFTEGIWNNEKASVEINTTDTKYILQYQINGTEKWNWIEATNGHKIEGLEHNDKVYARLWDGTNGTEPIKVDIIDKGEPTINKIDILRRTNNSVEIKVTAKDEESGIKEYRYYIGTELKGTNETGNYTYTELDINTTYKIKVIVVDKGENDTEQETEATTRLTAGNYINYVDKNGTTRKCVVLYDEAYNEEHGTNYGIQIITMNTVENVQIGNGTGSTTYNTNSTLFNTAKTSYNNAISTLNTRATAYLNTTYASGARCVGSVPNNPNYQSGYMTSTYPYVINSSCSGVFRNSDTNLQTDYDQISILEIINIDKDYWFASRRVYSDATQYTSFYIYHWSGRLTSGSHVNSISAGYSASSTSQTYGLRPVFTLLDTVKVTGGLGTSDSPYTLGI